MLLCTDVQIQGWGREGHQGQETTPPTAPTCHLGGWDGKRAWEDTELRPGECLDWKLELELKSLRPT